MFDIGGDINKIVKEIISFISKKREIDFVFIRVEIGMIVIKGFKTYEIGDIIKTIPIDNE